MARPDSELREAALLSSRGMSDAAVGVALGIPRSTVRDWRRAGFRPRQERGGCARCHHAALDEGGYAQLLGLYLGDGHIARQPRDVYRLRIFLDEKYPGIVAETVRLVSRVRERTPLGAGVVQGKGRGCVYVSSYWKHWPCLFPQHGPGRKHQRQIRLAAWQDRIVRRAPDRFLRGLIQSDGCRVVNRVGGREYARYMFCNHSGDVIALYRRACADFGIVCTQPSWRTVSVARAESVARLDRVVGPKR